MALEVRVVTYRNTLEIFCIHKPIVSRRLWLREGEGVVYLTVVFSTAMTVGCSGFESAGGAG